MRMNKNVFIVFMAVIFSTNIFSQNDIKVLKIEELKKVYIKPNDTTYIVNFFATWYDGNACTQQIL